MFRSPVIGKLEHTMEKPSLFSNCKPSWIICLQLQLLNTKTPMTRTVFDTAIYLSTTYVAHHHHVLGITEGPYVKPALFLNKFSKISNWEMLLKTHTKTETLIDMHVQHFHLSFAESNV